MELDKDVLHFVWRINMFNRVQLIVKQYIYDRFILWIVSFWIIFMNDANSFGFVLRLVLYTCNKKLRKH